MWRHYMAAYWGETECVSAVSACSYREYIYP